MPNNCKWVKVVSGNVSQSKKKKIEVFPLDANVNPDGIFISQAREFYYIFEKSIGDGFYADYLKENNYTAPYLINLGPCLTILHLAIELFLKALISLAEGYFDKDKYRHHNISKLLEVAVTYHPSLSIIIINSEYKLLILELSRCFNELRYGAKIEFRPNNRKGWKSKAPFSEFIEDIDHIVLILGEAFMNGQK